MQCVVCSREFEAQRKTALFCSASCRVKGNRMKVPERVVIDSEHPPIAAKTFISESGKEIPEGFYSGDISVKTEENLVTFDTNKGKTLFALAPEKEKKTNLDERGTLRPGQTQAEYIANIPERGYLADGSKCTHPIEEHYFSRCLNCMELVPVVTRVRKALLKESAKKKV